VTRSYLEVIFRHRLLLVAPVLVAFVAGTWFAFSQPRKYQAVASVWADTPVTLESTIGTTGGTTPPSAGQQAMLTELIATRGFMHAVAREVHGEALNRASEPQIDRILGEMRAAITTFTPGPHILSVAVKDETPQGATVMAQVLVEHFLNNQDELLQRRAETEIAFHKQQLGVAERAVAAARSAFGGQVPDPSSPAAAVLETAQQQRLDAQQSYESAVAASASIGDRSLVYVRDEATTASRLSRLKTLAFGAVGGTLAGVTVSLFTLVLLMARDRSVRNEEELESLLGLTVVGTIEDFGQRPRGLSVLDAPRGQLGAGAHRR
jgi:capsular polysaccharide biosynthesis protein